MPRQTIEPASRIGKFQAELDGDVLNITLPVFFHFLPGDPAVVPGLPIEEYQWTEDQEKAFAKTFRERVKKVWNSKFALESADGSRRIKVEVKAEEVTWQEAFWRIFVSRYSDDAPDTGASICPPGQGHYGGDCIWNPTGADWGTVQLSSTHAQPTNVRNLEIGSIEIFFGEGLIYPEQDFLRRPVTWWPTNEEQWFVELTGFADLSELKILGTESDHELRVRTTELARQRTAEVRSLLEANGVKKGQFRIFNKGHAEEEEYRQKVRLAIYRTEPIDTLAHEVGHMLGLGDEAITGSAVVDDPLADPNYAASVYWYAGELVRRHDDEGIMSRGSTVRWWHYSPFLEAMEILTGTAEWRTVTP